MFVKLLKGTMHTGRLLAGLLVYAVSGKTPAYAYQSMISLSVCMVPLRSFTNIFSLHL